MNPQERALYSLVIAPRNGPSTPHLIVQLREPLRAPSSRKPRPQNPNSSGTPTGEGKEPIIGAPYRNSFKRRNRLPSATFTTPPGVPRIAWAATATMWSLTLRHPFLGGGEGFMQRTRCKNVVKDSCKSVDVKQEGRACMVLQHCRTQTWKPRSGFVLPLSCVNRAGHSVS